MTLWFVLAAITVVALVLMLRPLLWGRREGTSREVLETAIYRDRLSEVKRDLERGLLSPAEAESSSLATPVARKPISIFAICLANKSVSSAAPWAAARIFKS